jgi:hypothetical protein
VEHVGPSVGLSVKAGRCSALLNKALSCRGGGARCSGLERAAGSACARPRACEPSRSEALRWCALWLGALRQCLVFQKLYGGYPSEAFARAFPMEGPPGAGFGFVAAGAPMYYPAGAFGSSYAPFVGPGAFGAPPMAYVPGQVGGGGGLSLTGSELNASLQVCPYSDLGNAFGGVALRAGKGVIVSLSPVRPGRLSIADVCGRVPRGAAAAAVVAAAAVTQSVHWPAAAAEADCISLVAAAL